MKNQALFSSKDKSKKLKCRLLQFLCAALRVNSCISRQYNVLTTTISLYITRDVLNDATVLIKNYTDVRRNTISSIFFYASVFSAQHLNSHFAYATAIRVPLLR